MRGLMELITTKCGVLASSHRLLLFLPSFRRLDVEQKKIVCFCETAYLYHVGEKKVWALLENEAPSMLHARGWREVCAVGMCCGEACGGVRGKKREEGCERSPPRNKKRVRWQGIVQVDARESRTSHAGARTLVPWVKAMYPNH